MGLHQKRFRRPAIMAVCLLSGLFGAGVGVAQAGTGENLTVQLWLNYDKAGATGYADAVSDPHNANFHHYLSPSGYAAKFGPSASSVDAVRSWLGQQGFTGVTVSAQRDYVRAVAPVSIVDKAFQVQMKTYSVAGTAKPVTANDRAITLPASIAGDVLGVSGLNNSQPTTNLTNAHSDAAPANCSHYFGENVQSGLPALDGRTSFPTSTCGYTATQLRAAYGMNNASTGKGVTVSYIEDGLPERMFDVLTQWSAANGLPAPKSTNYQEMSIGNGGACTDVWCVEAPLDVEAGYAMAPDAHQLVVSADTTNQGLQGLFDANTAVLDGNGSQPLASIASNSWGLTNGESILPGDYLNIMHSILLRAAVEGVGMYFASGDAPDVAVPASDPYATAVGGTTMAIDANNRDVFDTGWSDRDYVLDSATNGYDDNGTLRWAAGGGTSVAWQQPGYQKGVVPNSIATPGGDRGGPSRVVPDIGALADQTTGMDESFYVVNPATGNTQLATIPQGGTSMSTPLVAGMVAAAQQGQRTSFGFLNPVLYSLSGTSAVHDVLPVTSATPAQYRGVYCGTDLLCYGVHPSVWTFDSEDSLYTNQKTLSGYDTMTGVGAPNGQSFITALRRQAQ